MTQQKSQYRRTTVHFATIALLSVYSLASADPAAVILHTPAGTEGVSLVETARDARSANGVIDVLLLENVQAKGGKFDQYLAVTFKDRADSQAWVEKLRTADSEAIQVRLADVLTHGEIWPRDTNSAVFKVNDYVPIVNSKDYDAFADGYIRPLMEAQVGADIMTRYTMFFEHGDGGLVWSLYEYVSQDALDASAKIKDGIRENLTETDVSYRDFHPVKDGLRLDGGDTLATALDF